MLQDIVWFPGGVPSRQKRFLRSLRSSGVGPRHSFSGARGVWEKVSTGDWGVKEVLVNVGSWVEIQLKGLESHIFRYRLIVNSKQ